MGENDIKINGMKIDVEVRIISPRRSGHHAVEYWLMKQFNGSIFWCGSRSYGSDFVSYLSQFEPKLYIDSRGNKNKNLFSVFINYGDKLYEGVKEFSPAQRTNKRYDIIVIRDPYNTLASRIYHELPKKITKSKHIKVFVDNWKKYARTILNKNGRYYSVNFNKWFIDIDYRKTIISWFPELTFTDEGKENIMIPNRNINDPGSIATRKKWDGRASQLDVLNRYKNF